MAVAGRSSIQTERQMPAETARGMMSQPHTCGALRMNSPSSRCSQLMLAAS